ncbi:MULTISPECIES: hypothetical protein [Olivibacter]|jgi:hypothetical protein|uniref:Uncharacterized protein n=1 Tax=Olivibacter jilunii TaxID=985016 RepID=A0ABW6B1R4_9SPHI|nr:hypothetical protein [Olivibacter sp. 47]MDM8172877.1 hypothetical protein [Olivibacter sp. 47]
MKKQSSIYSSIIGVACVTLFLLLIPFVAMHFTNEVNWSSLDFIIMGALIFGTGISFTWLVRRSPNLMYRIAISIMVVATFLMIWANLAVGLIGSGPNIGNLMYIAVAIVVIVGSLLSQFKAAGMERAMYVTVLTLVVLATIALLAGMQHHGSSVIEILGVNGFFAGLFLVSAALFHYAAKNALNRTSL